MCASLNFLVRALSTNPFIFDPEDKKPPDQFDELHLQQLCRKVGKNYPEKYCRARAQQNPLFCRCFRGNYRTAAAITTALSPASIKSISTMLMRAVKKSQLIEISPS